MMMAPRFKYFNPDDPSATVAIAGVAPDSQAVFLNLPVISDKSGDLDKCKSALDKAKAEETIKKLAADEAWAKALDAQRAAKRAEAKADMTGNANDIKTAGDLAAKALEEKGSSEGVMQESREAILAAARAQSAMLSCAYQAVMQGDARHFDGESAVWIRKPGWNFASLLLQNAC